MSDLQPLPLIEDQPVDGRDGSDYLGMKPFARVLAATALGTQGPFTIGVFGGWGSGKTSLLRQAKALIDDDPQARKSAVTVWFNAWQFEREAHPLFPLIAAVVEAIQQRSSEEAGLGDSIRGRFDRLQETLYALAHGMKVSLKAGLPAGPEVAVELDGGKALDAAEKLHAQTNPLQGEMLYQTAFALLEQVTEGRDGEPVPKVIVFIDDLDRCMPANAVALLESIKLVLAQRGFVFLLGLDKSIVEDFLTRRYKREYGVSDIGVAGTYLHKIVQLEFPLPPHRARFEQYIRNLIDARLKPDPSHDLLTEITPVLAQGTAAIPRSLVRLLNNLLIDLRLWRETFSDEQQAQGWSDAQVATCIAVCRVARPVMGETRFARLVEDQTLCDAILAHEEPALPEDAESAPADALRDKREPESLLTWLRGNELLWVLLQGPGRIWLEKPDLRQRVYTFHRERDETADVPESQRAVFERAVRAALNLPPDAPIPASRLATVTGLDLINESGFDSTGLSLLSGLTSLGYLYLNGTAVSDLKPLQGLTNLSCLTLWKTQVSDVSPLSRLANMRELNLGGTQVSDLSPLSGLKSLRTLLLSESQVSDVSPLPELTSLLYLNLSGTQVSEVSPLSGLTSLHTLLLGGRQVSDVSPLSSLTNLTELYLTDTQVSDVSPLSGLTKLELLMLTGTPVSDEQVAALQRALPNLRIIR